MAERKIITVLEPSDEYCHEPDEATNYNESMYLNAFDLEQEVGGWFRLGNRVNEGYAEMTVCVYLPGGRVGSVYARPEITSNTEMSAGGLTIDVVEPFEHLKVTYRGKVCLLDDPRRWPNRGWRSRRIRGSSARSISTSMACRPCTAGVRSTTTAPRIEVEAEKSFAKAHYEQHGSMKGTIRVGEEVIDLDGFGLRDKSWGPRYWQAISWYRWLPFVFGADFAMMVSTVGGRSGGMVLKDGAYHLIRNATIESTWDDDKYQTAMVCHVETDDDTYEVRGEVISLIPLRNRRADPEGNQLVTRITEAMTRFECDGRKGIGMSEYLDQIVDGEPVGPDVA
ncbi:MAG: hypothetical protein R2710_00895 [Acidimicrobiales bacterium]